MPLTIADLATIGDTPITIRSKFFTNVYLRMDARGVTSFTGPGSGLVNCQYDAGPYERFKVHAHADGTYSFESANWSNAYLRMEGVDVPTSGAGGGTVNCQFGVHEYEKYKVHAQPDGSVSFESAHFPKVYLRLVGSGVTKRTESGGGIVNCQLNANGGGHETFFLEKG